MGARPYWFWVLPEHPRRISMREIAALVAERHGLSVEELRGPGRSRRLAHPRQEAFALIRKHTAVSLPQIGGYSGGRDHTTVLHGVRAHERRCAAAEAAK